MAASLRNAGRAAIACAALVACAALSAEDKPAKLPARNSEQPIDLQAASSDFDYKNNSLLFRRVKITQGGLQVTAQEARASGLNFDDSEWTLTGDVQILVPDGKLASNSAQVTFRTNQIVKAVITTEQLAYDTKANFVQTTEPVTLHFGTYELRGRGLRADLNAGTLRLESNVNGRFTP